MHRVQQRVRHINTNDYKRELAKARLGDNIANHMAFIFVNILYDKFDMSFKQITNYSNKTRTLRMLWQDDRNKDVTSASLLTYCVKKNIDVVGFVKSIPMSQKLYMADIAKGRAIVGAEKNIESAFLATILLTIPTLKETYRFSNAKIEEFLKWIAYFIDSYCRKQPGCKEHYLNDEMIRQIFIEEEHWDIVEGCSVKDGEL